LEERIFRFFHSYAKTSLLLILLFILSFFSFCSYPVEKNINPQEDTIRKETLYQVSTISALLAGAYDGEKTIKELRKYGDFGFGFVDQLDGEMIALEGEFYHIKVDGQVHPISDLMKIPFAAVTFFEMNKALSMDDGPSDFVTIKKALDSLVTNKNIFYAIRIDGEFESILTRSTQTQKKPYRRLDEVLRDEQEIKEHHRVNGTMVGFWYPVFTSGINIPGYHFDFITSDRKTGGHVLDCNLIKGTIQVDLTPNIHIKLLPLNSQNK